MLCQGWLQSKVKGNEQENNVLTVVNCVFSWITPLLQLGQKRRLEESDMYTVLPEDRSETLGEELQRSLT